VLDAEDERRRPYPYAEQALPRGARATWSWRSDGSFRAGHVAGGEVGSSFALPGPPLHPAVTDGSEGGVLVVQTPRGRLRGLGLTTGRMRWTQPSPTASPLEATALVDGVLLLDDGDTVTGLDARSGESRWRTQVDPRVHDAALTDGRVVLLPVRDDDGALQLAAHRVADGVVRWSTTLPPGTVSLAVVDHRLVASTGGEVVGLG
jgi:outer membrane protein assembly factor BamB